MLAATDIAKDGRSILTETISLTFRAVLYGFGIVFRFEVPSWGRTSMFCCCDSVESEACSGSWSPLRQKYFVAPGEEAT